MFIEDTDTWVDKVYILAGSQDMQMKWKLLSGVWLFVTPWAIESMEFSGPEYWSW